MQQLGAGVEDLLPLAELLHKAGIGAASFKELAAVFTAAAAAPTSTPKQPAPVAAPAHSTWSDTLAQPPQRDVTPRHPAGTYSDQGAFTVSHYDAEAAGQALHAGHGGQRLQLLQLPGADAAAHVTHACAGAEGCGPAAAAVRDSSPPGVHAVGDLPHTGWAGASAPVQQQPPCVSPPSSKDGAACYQQQHSSPRSQRPEESVLLPAQQQQQQQAQPELDVRAEQQELDAHRQALAEQQWKLRELLVLLQESNPQEEQPAEPHPVQPEEPLCAAAPAAPAAAAAAAAAAGGGSPQQQQPHSSNDSEADALLLMAGTPPDTADQQDQHQLQQEQQQEPLAAAVAAVVEYLAAAIRSAAADQASGAGEQGAAAADGAAAAAGGWAGGSAHASPTAAGGRHACRALQWPAAEPTPFGAAAAHDDADAAAAARHYSHGASAAAGGCAPHTTPLDKLLQLAEVATQQGCGPAAAEGEAGEDEAAAEAAAPRWACSNEIWTSEDGLTVWPKDSPITPTPRVFYLTFKWVADHWPHSAAEASAASSTHVTATTAEFYLDGEDTAVTMDVKVRLYNRAVHLVLSPYSKLSKAFPRKWLAGYAYDRTRDRVRLYLASAKPLPPQLPAEPKAPRAPKVKPAPVSVDGGYGSHESGKQSARKRRRLDPWALHAAAAAAAGYPFPVPPYAHVGLGLPPMVPYGGRPGVGVPLTWSHPPAAVPLGAHMPPAAAMVSCPPGVVMMQPHPYGAGPMLLPAAGGAVGGGAPGHYGYVASGPLAGPHPWEQQQQWLQEPGAQQLMPPGQQVMVQGRLLHPQQPEVQMQALAAFLEHQQRRALMQEQQQQQLMLLQQQTVVKQQTAVVLQPPYHPLPQQPQQAVPSVQLQHPAQQQEQQMVVVCEPLISSQ